MLATGTAFLSMVILTLVICKTIIRGGFSSRGHEKAGKCDHLGLSMHHLIKRWLRNEPSNQYEVQQSVFSSFSLFSSLQEVEWLCPCTQGNNNDMEEKGAYVLLLGRLGVAGMLEDDVLEEVRVEMVHVV